jgi:hypothetical protein
MRLAQAKVHLKLLDDLFRPAPGAMGETVEQVFFLRYRHDAAAACQTAYFVLLVSWHSFSNLKPLQVTFFRRGMRLCPM